MNHLLIYPLLFSFFLSPAAMLSQVSGKVSDEQNQPLPFATIYLEGTTIGTTANEQGKYRIDIPTGSGTLVFQYVGFQTQRRDVQSGSTPIVLEVVMPAETVQLSEVVVRADSEDPAYAIIRNAIAKRKYHLGQVQEYACDVYVKGTIKLLDAPEKILGKSLDDMGGVLDSTRSGILYLSESVSKLYVQGLRNKKEVMVSSKVSGNDNGFSFNSAMDMDLNFYENLLELGRQAVSPIADGALAWYRYKLHGAFYDQGRLVYKIEVLPKNEAAPVVAGFIYITEGLWNIHSTDLLTTGRNMQQPIIDTMRIRQTHVPVGEPDAWRLFSQTYSFTGGLFGFRFGGAFTAVYSNYDLSPDFPKGFFSNELMKVQPDANRRDSTYWESFRPVPLTEEEIADYKKKDSLEVLRSSPEYQDSLDRANNRFRISNVYFGYVHQNSRSNTTWSVWRPFGNALFNTVQGFSGEMTFKWQRRQRDPERRRFGFNAGVNYGFSEEKWRPSGDLQYDYDLKKQGSVKLEGGQKLAQFNDADPIIARVNAQYSLLFRRNYIRLYDKRYIRGAWQQEVANGLTLQLSAQWAKRSAVGVHSDYSFLYSDARIYEDNLPGLLAEDDPALRGNDLLQWTIGVSLRPKQQYIDYPQSKMILGTRWPTFQINLTQGLVTDGQPGDFFRISAAMDKSNIPLGIAGVSSAYLEGGTFFEKEALFFADFKHFVGNRTNLAVGNSRKSFKALRYYDYSTPDAWVQAHWEHDFKGFILDKIPLLKKTGFSLVTGAAFLRTSELDSYGELSVGLDRIGIGPVRLFRFDLAASWVNGNYQGLSWLIGIPMEAFDR